MKKLRIPSVFNVIDVLLKSTLVTSCFVYIIGWVFDLIGYESTRLIGGKTIIVMVVLTVTLFIVSWVRYKGGKNVQIFFIILILSILPLMAVMFTLKNVTKEVDALIGFTEFVGYEWEIQPKYKPAHEGVRYLLCTLQGEQICLSVMVKPGLFYQPYQVCNITSPLFYKTQDKLSRYDLLKKTYLDGKNITLECRDSWLTKLFQIRDGVIEKIMSNLHQPQSSLLAGIIFGLDFSFDDSFANAVKASGISHIVAASGYNVNILILGIDKVFVWLPKKCLNTLKISLIWLYALLTGFSSSMVRASAMSSLIIFSDLFNWKIKGEDVFKLTFCILFILNPLIMYDLGFLLSVSATWGLMYLTGILQKWIKLSWFPHTTLACTIATLPITILHFNTISVYSLLANMVILPMIEIVMLVGLVGLAVKPFLYVAYGSLKFVEYVSYSVASLPYSIIELKEAHSLFVFIIIILFIFYILKKSNESKCSIDNN